MSYKEGKTIIFAVEYLGRCGCGFKRKVTRKFELKDSQTLDDLHEAIIYDSFQWDDPHLYSFFMDNKSNSENKKMEYSCDTDPDFLDEPRKSSNISLKKLNLKKAQNEIIAYIQKNGRITKKECANLFNISDDTSLRELSTLKMLGLIDRKGVSTSTYYVIK